MVQSAKAQEHREEMDRAELNDRRRQYDFLLAEAEEKSAQQQIAADEEGRLQGERMRASGANVPGLQEDVEDVAAANIMALLSAGQVLPGGQELQNIGYLALEQSGTFGRAEKYIQHVVNVTSNLKSESARDRFLAEQNNTLEFNALTSEGTKYIQDMQRELSLGFTFSTPTDPGAQGGQAPGGERGQGQPAEAGLAPNQQAIEAVQLQIEQVQEAMERARGNPEESRAARGMIRQFRADAVAGARQAQQNRIEWTHIQGQLAKVDADLQEAYARDDGTATMILERRIQLEQEASGLFVDSGGEVAQGAGQEAYEAYEAGPQAPPTREELLAERERRRSQGGAPAAPEPSIDEIASQAVGKADDLEAEAAAVERYDPTGAAKMRDEAKTLRESKEAKAPEMEAKKRAELSSKLAELGVTVDPFKGPGSASMAIAQLYRASNEKSKKGRAKVRSQIRKLFNLEIDKAFKIVGVDAKGANSIVDALTSGKTLNEVLEKFTPFKSMREVEAAMKQEDAAAVEPQFDQPAGPEPAPQVQPTQGSPATPAPVQAPVLNERGGDPSLPQGAAGGMKGGRRGGANKRQRQK